MQGADAPVWVGVAAVGAGTLAAACLWQGHMPPPSLAGLGLAPWALLPWALWRCRGFWRESPAWLRAASALVFSSLLVMALTPLSARDGMSFHLAFPKKLLQEGPAPFWTAFDTYYTFIPLLGHMLYFLSLPWSESTALLWLPLGYLGTLWALRRLQRELNPEAPPGWMGLACLPLAWFAAGGYLDVVATCAAMLSLVALFRALAVGGSLWLAAAGILAGALPTLKPTGIFFPGILLAFLLWRRRFAGALLFATSAASVLAPWLVRDWIATGNPVYYLARHGGLLARMGSPYILQDPGFALGTGLRWKDWLLLPVLLLGSAPWLVGLARAALDRRFSLLWMLLTPVPLIAAASYCSPENVVRWSLPYLLPSAVLGGIAPGRIGKGFLILGLLATALFSARRLWDRGPVLLGLESRRAFLARKIPSYHAIERLNRMKPGRVLLVGALGYHLDPPPLHARDDHAFVPYGELRSLPDLLAWARPHGISHLLVERNPPDVSRTFLNWLKRDGIPDGLCLVYEDPGAFVFEVSGPMPSGPTGKPPAP